MLGGCVSFTVIVNMHAALLPAISATVQVTVVVPTGKNEPDPGEHIGAPIIGQLSETVGGG